MSRKRGWELGAGAASLLVLAAVGGTWLRGWTLTRELERTLGKGEADAPYIDCRQVQRLVEQGADVNVRGGGGCTPLMAAAEYGNLPLVEQCLARGARANEVSNLGISAMEWACAHPDPADLGIIHALLEAGANPNGPGLSTPK